MAHLFSVLGFLLIVVGVGLWSIPAACVVAGCVLLVGANLMERT